MVNNLINLRIPKSLYLDVEKMCKKNGYKNMQDFTREALREKVRKLNLYEGLIKLKSLENKQEIKRLSKKELAKMVEEVYGI